MFLYGSLSGKGRKDHVSLWKIRDGQLGVLSAIARGMLHTDAQCSEIFEPMRLLTHQLPTSLTVPGVLVEVSQSQSSRGALQGARQTSKASSPVVATSAAAAHEVDCAIRLVAFIKKRAINRIVKVPDVLAKFPNPAGVTTQEESDRLIQRALNLLHRNNEIQLHRFSGGLRNWVVVVPDQ